MSDYSREGLGGGSRERPSVDEGSSARKSPRLEDEPLPSCEFFSLLLLKKSLKHIFFAHLFEGGSMWVFLSFFSPAIFWSIFFDLKKTWCWNLVQKNIFRMFFPHSFSIILLRKS